MPLKVTYKNLQRGPFQRLLFTIENNFENYTTNEDEEVIIKNHEIDNMAELRLRFEQVLPANFSPENENPEDPIHTFVMVAAKKHASAKHLCINLDITVKALDYSEQIVCTEKWTEYLDVGQTACVSVGGTVYISNELEICLNVNKAETVTFAKLYDDTVLTDFHLSTAEGSVAVHKACLAAHSDVFKSMFSGAWKETADGRIKLEGVTLNSLRHLKDYVYLGTLPDEGLRPLLLLASYYFMEPLKTQCIMKLVKFVKSEDLYDLLVFACENNIPELTFTILLQIPDDVVHKTYEMKKHKQISQQADEE